MNEEQLNPCPFCGDTELDISLRWVDDDTPERWNFKRKVIKCVGTSCFAQPSVWGEDNWNNMAAIRSEDRQVLWSALSKLDSQIQRNQHLPRAYGAILIDALDVLRRITGHSDNP